MIFGAVRGLQERRFGRFLKVFFYSASITVASATITQCPTNQIILAGPQCTGTLQDLRSELQCSDPNALISQSPPAGTELGLGTNAVTFAVQETNELYYCTNYVVVVDTTVQEKAIRT